MDTEMMVPLIPAETVLPEPPQGAVAQIDNQFFTKADILAWLTGEEKRFRAKARDGDPQRMHAAYDQAEACSRLRARLEKLDPAKSCKMIDVRKELALLRDVVASNATEEE
jgi:hypothetical protein